MTGEPYVATSASSRKPTPGIEERERAGGRRYRAVVFDAATGRKISKTFDTITAAKRWRTDARAAVAAGRLSADRGPTLAAETESWLAALRAGHIRNRSGDPYKPSAIRGYEQNIRLRVLPALGQVRLAEIRHKDLQRLVDGLVSDGASPSTIVTTITPLRAIFRRALTRGVVQVNPTRGLEMPAVRATPRRHLSPDEARSLLAGLCVEDRPLWATAFYAGLRRGELAALRWEDVNLGSGVIHVCRGWDHIEGEIAPKSRQGKRKVPVPAVLRDYLLDHRMRSPESAVQIFGAKRGIEAAIRRAKVAWGEDAVTLHEGRHTYASLMIAAGVNAKALSTFMGHANIAITLDLYGHLMPGAEEEAADLLDVYLARAADNAESDCSEAPTSPETSPTAA